MKDIQEDRTQDHNYEGDFWPGFVDIMSGIILALSFLVLIAGIIIAIIFKVNVTVKILKDEEILYKYVLTILQESPLLTEAQFDVIEKAKEGEVLRVLVSDTARELENVAERTHVVREEYPELKRRILQEISFLELQVDQLSNPPQGQTESLLKSKGGFSNNTVARSKVPPAEKNWDVRRFNESLLVQFTNASSARPEAEAFAEFRASLLQWLNDRKGTIQLSVKSADAVYQSLANRDSLARVLYVRDVIRSFDPTIKMSISKNANTPEKLKDEKFGWILITLE